MFEGIHLGNVNCVHIYLLRSRYCKCKYGKNTYTEVNVFCLVKIAVFFLHIMCVRKIVNVAYLKFRFL